ncbi:hypothetical protein D1159_13635 [Pseudoflavonifractor sp. 524-17]|uniref:hypothetical protein n=1 Tax=Pseudoflavonifractor sp. 524-17 TaxID=2304577 RepID=UPI00137A9E61|nr:hypothetical protein [Pseudoflavonifractor sp. 524-17]NCE65593.1 hypothetical protein [Pseudoflavonifractor sp. 524-17]
MKKKIHIHWYNLLLYSLIIAVLILVDYPALITRLKLWVLSIVHLTSQSGASVYGAFLLLGAAAGIMVSLLLLITAKKTVIPRLIAFIVSLAVWLFVPYPPITSLALGFHWFSALLLLPSLLVSPARVISVSQ